MMLDVFKDDAFSFTELIAAINKVPYVPTKLGRMGLFQEEGVSTLSVAIEMENNVLTLVPTAPRGASGQVKGLQRRNVRDFRPVHLPQRVHVYADEVQNLRAFGSQTDVELAMNRLRKKMAVARRDLDVTHEFQRMGALKGIVYDADGTSVLYNFLTEFGVTALTDTFTLSSTSTKVLQEIVGFKRQIEDKLGGVMVTGWTALCGSTFFDNFTGHPAVEESYRYQQGNVLREDRREGFEFGKVWWEEYRGQVGGNQFLAADKCLLIPEGVPDMFKSVFAPANYMETVNTEGVPFYMKAKTMDFDVGVEWDVQSNPLHINTRPDCVMEITAN